MGRIWLGNMLFGRSFDGEKVACRKRRSAFVKILELEAIAMGQHMSVQVG